MATSTMASKLKPATRRSSPAPGSPVDGTSNDGALPLDLLYDILLRLPAKSLCRFRAVCASWRSLLCHEEFIAAAATHADTRLAVGVCGFETFHVVCMLDMDSGDIIKRVSTYDTWPPRQPGVVSLDRAVCVVSYDRRLRLVDPANGAISLLPDHSPPHDRIGTSGTIGHVFSTGEFKLLAMDTRIYPEGQVCKVLTLGGNEGWRKTRSPLFGVVSPPSTTYSRHTIVMGGVAYFLVLGMYYPAGPELDGHEQDWIMAFDFESEAWWPAALRGPVRCCGIGLAGLDGRLVAFHDDRRTGVQLWSLVDPERALWSRLHKIVMPYHKLQPPPSTSRAPAKESFLKPLAVLEDGRFVVCTMVRGRYGDDDALLRFYDPRTGVSTDGTRVASCNHVSVYNWSLLYSGRGAAADQHK